jgi:subtilisin family serine protease
MDSGVEFNHEDLAANLWTNAGETPGNGIDDDHNGWVDDVHGVNCLSDAGGGMDDNGHGTHVAGTIGAVGNNAIGVVGVDWSVSIMALKMLGSSGSGSIDDAVQCLDYATSNGVTLTNNSWTGGGFSQAMYDAISRARSANELFVAAAGNSGANNDTFPAFGYPSSYNLDNIIAVASTDQNDGLASSSNYGATSVDRAAPGVGILSTVPNNGYATMSGTSMATPHVAGAAALLVASRPGAAYSVVRSRIFQTADPVASLQGKVATGGRLNVARAIFPPETATGLTGTAVSSSEIDLSWTDVSGETGYKVQRSADGTSGWTQIGTTGQDVATYADTGLAAETTFFYRVLATNTGGDSAPSTVASATTKADASPPTVPSGVTASGAKATVNLRWTTSTDTGGSGLAGYEIWRAASASGTFSRVGTTTQTSYSDGNLPRKQTFWYYVVAFDAAGNRSGPSNTASARTA